MGRDRRTRFAAQLPCSCRPGQLCPDALVVPDLLDYTDVPTHQKIPFIFGGYRPKPQGIVSLLASVFSLHNETGNIWTHLLGAVYFTSVGLELLRQIIAEEKLGHSDHAAVLGLILATNFCLVCSFFYHLCKCSGPGVCDCTHKMDLLGIVALIAASYCTGISLGFRCSPFLRTSYLAYTVVVVAMLAGPLIRPSLVSDMTRHMILCVALGLVPAVHWLRVSSADSVALMLPYLVAMFSCYGAGACFFVARWPERQWPGRFDLIGHSHQIWHVFVVLAAVSWVEGSLEMLAHYTASEC